LCTPDNTNFVRFYTYCENFAQFDTFCATATALVTARLPRRITSIQALATLGTGTGGALDYKTFVGA
jgi:hypothetical protein